MPLDTPLLQSTSVRHPIGSASFWAAVLVAVSAAGVIFSEGLSQMGKEWSREEYSHAYLIPFLSAALIWRKKRELEKVELRGAWGGVLILLAGLVVAVFGELSTIYLLINYGLVICIFGVATALLGWNGVKTIWTGIFYIFFMIPLPVFLYQTLSNKMQLISSDLGVSIIRLFGISVLLEGNIIDLGAYQLQVVEACSGLRYLFPLLSFGFLFACIYNGSYLHKCILFLSAAPITIIINSIRIGITGIIVEYIGISAAEGFLHLFEGWIIFLAGVGLFFFLAWILARASGRGRSLGAILDLRWLEIPKRPVIREGVSKSKPFVACVGLLAGIALASTVIPARSEIVPERKPFTSFPMNFGPWLGREQKMEEVFLEKLKLDDYVLANYARSDDEVPINFYVAYYGSQRKGVSAHSPRSCIPGGGWEISELRTHRVDGVLGTELPLVVNRAVIAKGTVRQVVFYWFQQRGRVLTNEYIVKWMIFWDALTRRRTDGALIRLITPVPPSGDLEAADQRLADFLRASYPAIADYVPG
jgi:exosortase D (VPLPA-CTERM-specific)